MVKPHPTWRGTVYAMTNTEIDAKGSIHDGIVSVTLTLGEARLVVTFPQHSAPAAEDMTSLITRAEESVTTVLEALVAEATRRKDAGL